MLLIDELAEAHIQRALERGELDNLPGSGAPLSLDDDRDVPEALRAAYRLLKNAGYVPEEVRLYGRIREVESLLRQIDDPEEGRRAARKLSLMRARLDGRFAAVSGSGYLGKLLANL